MAFLDALRQRLRAARPSTGSKCHPGGQPERERTGIRTEPGQFGYPRPAKDSQKCARRVARLEGLEPPTHGLEDRIRARRPPAFSGQPHDSLHFQPRDLWGGLAPVGAGSRTEPGQRGPSCRRAAATAHAAGSPGRRQQIASLPRPGDDGPVLSGNTLRAPNAARCYEDAGRRGVSRGSRSPGRGYSAAA